jgi:Holliday junction DNA helicase RuvA
VIAKLTGTLSEVRPDRVVMDVNGVGYDVAIPLGTFTALPAVGHKATLFIHTHVREDALQLFGFVSKQEKLVFETLIGVSGIGPKVALAILSGLPLPELVGAIAAQNARLLSSIPGVGKKLAERLGVELKEKMAEFGFGDVQVKGGRISVVDDAIAALKNLGYKAAQAEAAVTAAARKVSVDDLNAILEAALKSLAVK